MSDALPSSLTDPVLAPLWAEVSDRLARNGLDWRGRIRLPDLPPSARLTVESLTGAKGRTTVDLTALEAGLLAARVGDDLPRALARLGHPVSTVHAERRAARAATAAARDAARERAATWPEPWAEVWVDEVIRAKLLAGLDVAGAVGLVDQVRSVLNALADAQRRVDDGMPAPSRVELAARVLGSAHALDHGTRLERAATRALALDQGSDGTPGPELWARAGATPDLLSGAVVTWNLRLVEGHPMAEIAHRSTRIGLPFVCTQIALLNHPLEPVPGLDVLVVENPRVLERAVVDRADVALVCGSGNPTSTVRLLVTQLLAGGATVRYHGDFDAAGLAITARMHALGLEPWRMTARDYLDAVATSEAAGVTLPLDPNDAGPTPWDPDLQQAFNAHHRVVHEERLLDTLLHL